MELQEFLRYLKPAGMPSEGAQLPLGMLGHQFPTLILLKHWYIFRTSC